MLKMKKKILSICVLVFFVVAILLHTNVFGVTYTLEEIADIFNNSNIIKNYGDLLGINFSASEDITDPNVLIITLTDDNSSSTINYELDGDILSCESLVDNNLITAYLLADSVGQLNGYNDGELIENFNAFFDEISNYTLENEGFEINENGNYYSAKMDITKKVPLIDLSEFYLKQEDFEELKSIIESGESGNQTGKNSKIVYNVIINDDYNSIYMGEISEITESTYKSILSVLDVMYGNTVVEYFESIYPEFSDGITQLDGFVIEKDVEMDLDEQPMFTDASVVLVTIDNEYINDEFFRTEYIGETVKYGNKTIELDFTKNDSFKLGFFDQVSSSDVAFLFKYILEPVFEESDQELDDNTVYYNIIDGKIVVGDKNNSIFKLVIEDEYIEILPTKINVEKTTVTAKHKNVCAIEYEEGKSQDHFRYGEYNVTVNVIYGKGIEEEKTTNTKAEIKKTNNPKTGDVGINIWIGLMTISFLGIIGIAKIKRKKQIS